MAANKYYEHVVSSGYVHDVRSLKMPESVPSDLIGLIRGRISELNDRTVLVGHLPKTLLLKVLLKTFDTAVNGRIPNKKFQANRKYALLEFPSSSAAKEAAEKADHVKFNQRVPKCEIMSHRIMKRPLFEPHTYQLDDFLLTSLQISCLPRTATEDDIRSLFPDSLKIQLPHAGPSKTLGFARVDYTSQSKAIAAFRSKHGALVNGSPIIVNFCIRKKTGQRHQSRMEGNNETKGGGGELSKDEAEVSNRKRTYSEVEADEPKPVASDKKKQKQKRRKMSDPSLGSADSSLPTKKKRKTVKPG